MRNGSCPDGEEMPSDFGHGASLTGLAALVLDDGDAFHEVGDGDEGAGDGEVDGGCGGAVGGDFGERAVFVGVDDDLEEEERVNLEEVGWERMDCIRF